MEQTLTPCCGIGHRLSRNIPTAVYAISNSRLVHAKWDDIQWNVLFNDTLQIRQGRRTEEFFENGIPPDWANSSLAWTEADEKFSHVLYEQLKSTTYAVYEREPKMLMEMLLAQTIVKSLAENLSPLVLSFLEPMREQFFDSDLHLCTHVREGNGEFQTSYVERQMEMLPLLNSTLLNMINFAKSRNVSKVSLFVAYDNITAWEWFVENTPQEWHVVKPAKPPHRPSSGHWFEHGKVLDVALTQLEKNEAMAEAVADVFALGECDALFIPKYSSFSVIGIMMARADGRKVFFRETMFENSTKFIKYPDKQGE
ncbi:hypothetical protein ACHAW5_002686 [Stephanodiscus triporus]|uniref:Uncharacterized protein n=1 Tax=Stephanodiscus triporus TaxID=2934178 RepID=A0ABD3NY15_9STRA